MSNPMWPDNICDECAGNCAWCEDKDECKCSCNVPTKNDGCDRCDRLRKEIDTEILANAGLLVENKDLRVELRKNINRIESLLCELDSIYNLADDGGN